MKIVFIIIGVVVVLGILLVLFVRNHIKWLLKQSPVGTWITTHEGSTIIIQFEHQGEPEVLEGIYKKVEKTPDGNEIKEFGHWSAHLNKLFMLVMATDVQNHPRLGKDTEYQLLYVSPTKIRINEPSGSGLVYEKATEGMVLDFGEKGEQPFEGHAISGEQSVIDMPSTNDMMEAYAMDAVEHAKATMGIDLDYTPESVEKVEMILDRMHKTMPRGGLSRLLKGSIPPDIFEQACKMYGGYIGEVLRRHSGGEWRIDNETDPAYPVIGLWKDEHRIWPPVKVGKRLTNGPEDNVWHYFQLIQKEW